MHTPKHEFVRKPRKLVSKDKNLHLGDYQVINKQKSKDSQQKKQSFQNSPNKPHNLISNLRFQLTNLKQEVAKLSKKQNKQSNQQSQIKLEYDLRSPKEKRQKNSYFFYSKKHSVLSMDKQSSRSKLKTAGQTQVIIAETVKKNEQIQSMKMKIQDFQRKNELLARRNQDLNVKIKQMTQMYKQEFQRKVRQIENQRQRPVKPKYQQQNDITINYQKKYLENKEYVQNLTKKIELAQSQNQKLKIKMEKYLKLQSLLEQRQAELVQKQKYIQKLTSALKQLKEQSMKAKQQDLLETQKLKNNVKQQMDIISKNMQRIRFLQTSNKQHQKNTEIYLKNISQLRDKYNKTVSQLESKNELQIKTKLKQEVNSLKKNKGSRIQVKNENKQLYNIIQLQEKSIVNQQSDINYLQTQLRKLSFLKLVSKNQSDIIQGLNQEIVRINLENMNKKYKIHYK